MVLTPGTAERATVADVATLADVAALARVSLATASKALNDRPGISAQTRDRVRRAAVHLSYGRSNTGRPGTELLTIGVVVMMLDSHWVTPIVAGAEDAIPPEVATIVLSPPAHGITSARARLDAMLVRGVDGVIVIADSTNPISPLTGTSTVPIVYAYGPSSDPSDASFVPDNVQAGRIVGEHLISRHRSKVAFINGDPGFDAARDRYTGLVQALGDTELVGRSAVYGDWSEGWGRRGVTSLMKSGAEVDAVVAGADRVARGAMDALRAAGKRIPQDVAVAGFDNWDELAMNAWPPLTTVDMNLTELGRQAGLELRRRMEGEPSEPGTRVLPVRLVPRESTAGF